MGEIAEMMLEGAMCEQCGEFIDDGEECGYPRLCAGCSDEQQESDPVPWPNTPLRKVACPKCGKRVKVTGLKDHQRDRHGVVQ